MGADPLLRRYLAHQPSLERQVGEGLLAVDVLACPHGQHGGEGVGVIRGRDDDGVDAVMDMKKAICNEKKSFKEVDYNALQLWKVSE